MKQQKYKDVFQYVFANARKISTITVLILFLSTCKEIDNLIRGNLKWSKDQGEMNWDAAKEKCASIGMRLPTKEELVAAYNSSKGDGWLKSKGYWSSTTPHFSNILYASQVDFNSGDVNGGYIADPYNVRCFAGVN